MADGAVVIEVTVDTAKAEKAFKKMRQESDGLSKPLDDAAKASDGLKESTDGLSESMDKAKKSTKGLGDETKKLPEPMKAMMPEHPKA